VLSVAFDPVGRTLASGSLDGTVKVWELASGQLLCMLQEDQNTIISVAFDPAGRTLASGGSRWSRKDIAELWELTSGKLLCRLEGHQGSVMSVAFDPTGRALASASGDKTVNLWDVASGKLLRALEGHTDAVEFGDFSDDGRLFASIADDDSIRVWRCDTWDTVAIIPQPTDRGNAIGLSFHPRLPIVAAVGSEVGATENHRAKVVYIWELDLQVLLGTSTGAEAPPRAVHHTTAKIVLVGDHSVGKSGLGYRLVHGEFKEQASTHGQQFWVLPTLVVLGRSIHTDSGMVS
jgi:hypothetical protein